MTTNQNIENLVDQTLNSLEGIRKASPKPFFFTRLKAKLMQVEQNGWDKLCSFIARPSIAFGLVAIILLLNTWAFFTKIHPKNVGSAVMAGQTETVGSEEYGIAAIDYNYFEESQ
jgi:hypothetical protein